MIRNLKALGLALVAVFAMSAMAASAASAQGVLTSDGDVKLSGTEDPATLTAFGNQKVQCHASYAAGKVNDTPHGLFTPPISTITVKPTYTNCTAFIGDVSAPATVTTNKCDFVIHIGGTLEAGKYGGTADVVCESPTEAIEVHAYTSSSHGSTICTVKVGPQTGLSGGYAENIANGDVTLGGSFTGIHATKTGILCGGSATTNAAVQHVDAVVAGTNAGGGATDIELSH